MAQAPNEAQGGSADWFKNLSTGRKEEDNGFTVDYGKFSVVTMKEWGYMGTDDNYAYFLIDNASKEVMAIDPKVWDKVVKPRWEQLNAKKDYTMKGILNTHKHADHSGGNLEAIKYYGDSVPLYAGECTHDANWQKNHFINVLDKKYESGLTLGKDTHIKSIHVPCHTRGHVLFHVTSPTAKDDNGKDGNKHDTLLFTGDTMFVGGVGKFFEEQGTPGVEMQNNYDIIRKMENSTLIYPGHEYAVSNYKFGEWIDNNNENLKNDLKLCDKKDKNNNMIMCIPSNVEKEKESNVFMRTNDKNLQKRIVEVSEKVNGVLKNDNEWNKIYDSAKRSNEPAWHMAMLRLLKNKFRDIKGKI